jgi:hypothetical protein
MHHIDPHVLLEAAEGVQLEHHELNHLRICEDCRDWLRIFTRNFTQTLRRPVRRQPGAEAA